MEKKHFVSFKPRILDGEPILCVTIKMKRYTGSVKLWANVSCLQGCPILAKNRDLRLDMRKVCTNKIHAAQKGRFVNLILNERIYIYLTLLPDTLMPW